MKKIFRSTGLYVVLALVVLIGATMVFSHGEKRQTLTLTDFQTELEAGNVLTAVIQDKSNEVLGVLRDQRKYKVTYPAQYADDVTDDLKAHKVRQVKVNPQNTNIWLTLLFNLLPFSS